MRIAKNWKDFELLDATNGEKLERWGDVLLVRPDPQVIWKTERSGPWDEAAGRYIRSADGGGSWDMRNHSGISSRKLQQWDISYGELRFRIKPTGFKHTGLFPEQAVNWELFGDIIRRSGRPLRVLNLFAYTGGASVACAAAGAQVCHVDASKGMVNWARDNAALSLMSDKPIRWIVDDCRKFVERELRRGKQYDAVIMDPPSYGRGSNGEVWKLEDEIYSLVELCAGLLSDEAEFFAINSYTTGLSASVMEYILGILLKKPRGGKLECGEIGLTVKSTGHALPCGSTALWRP